MHMTNSISTCIFGRTHPNSHSSTKLCTTSAALSTSWQLYTNAAITCSFASLPRSLLNFAQYRCRREQQ